MDDRIVADFAELLAEMFRRVGNRLQIRHGADVGIAAVSCRTGSCGNRFLIRKARLTQMNMHISETGKQNGTTNINFFGNVRKRIRTSVRHGKYTGRSFGNENKHVIHDAVSVRFSSGKKSHKNLHELQSHNSYSYQKPTDSDRFFHKKRGSSYTLIFRFPSTVPASFCVPIVSLNSSYYTINHTGRSIVNMRNFREDVPEFLIGSYKGEKQRKIPGNFPLLKYHFQPNNRL